MVLPLYLAMTAREMAASPALPPHWGWMACHFSPGGPGLADLPEGIPPGAMLILDDRFPCRGHDPARVAAQLRQAVEAHRCVGVLLDFERNPAAEARTMVEFLTKALPCPMAAPPGYGDGPVFLPPCPLHVPLAEYLAPWQGREIWLDVTMQRQTITVTPEGTDYAPAAPADRQEGGWFDDVLQCQCILEIAENAVRFTLFDTPQTLAQKLDTAAGLGVSKAVGLYQELGGKL